MHILMKKERTLEKQNLTKEEEISFYILRKKGKKGKNRERIADINWSEKCRKEGEIKISKR